MLVLWWRILYTQWNTSTLPSHSISSMRLLRAMNVPVRPTPALRRKWERWRMEKGNEWEMSCDHMSARWCEWLGYGGEGRRNESEMSERWVVTTWVRVRNEWMSYDDMSARVRNEWEMSCDDMSVRVRNEWEMSCDAMSARRCEWLGYIYRWRIEKCMLDE